MFYQFCKIIQEKEESRQKSWESRAKASLSWVNLINIRESWEKNGGALWKDRDEDAMRSKSRCDGKDKRKSKGHGKDKQKPGVRWERSEGAMARTRRGATRPYTSTRRQHLTPATD